MTRSFPAVSVEGGLFSPEIFDWILEGEVGGQRPGDFDPNKKKERELTAAIAQVFAETCELWTRFRRRLEEAGEAREPLTSETREKWVVPLLKRLKWQLIYNKRAYELGGMTFAISHRGGSAEYAPPVHIVGVNQELGRVARGGRPRLAPHSLVQEFLNRSEALWGVVTNGRRLRLLRDSTYVSRQCYVEFDLEMIYEQRLFRDFEIFYRLIHRTRFPQGDSPDGECFLEHYYRKSVDEGGRIRERLRDSVKSCIEELADGFLSHPRNEGLRRSLRTGRLSPEEFYRQLLRLIYRFLFLLVSEQRGVLSRNRLYLDHYGMSRFWRLVDSPQARNDDVHEDLWHSLRVVWRVLRDESPPVGGGRAASALGLPVLNGELFSRVEFDDCSLANRYLLDALNELLYYRLPKGGGRRRVNYAALDVEELGSVYESLLDYHPSVESMGSDRLVFKLLYGSERKSTGSYYTPAPLVDELVRSALEPVMKKRLRGKTGKSEKREALLSIKVVDPACGSGHFLLAAARKLGKELARIETGEDEPAPERVRESVREVIRHCIYGVDKNPLAVELCKVALWLESHTPNKPLTFLDHRIKCGDSLIGVVDLETLGKGIPDGAYEAVGGDDKKEARRRRFLNKKEKETESLNLLAAARSTSEKVEEWVSVLLGQMETIPDDSPASIRRKREMMEQIRREGGRLRCACDLWCAAFFQPKIGQVEQEECITTEKISRCLHRGEGSVGVLRIAEEISSRVRFFHWPVEFPDVFLKQDGPSGFDVVLGNPPWERIKLQDKEFFATRSRAIADAPRASERKKMIESLKKEAPEVYREYKQELYAAESISRYLRHSELYPLTGRGDINTYSVFSERMWRLLCPGGHAGVIVPTGIATDKNNHEFIRTLVDHGALVSIFDFENREAIFSNVHRSYKFSLMTLEGVSPGERERSASSPDSSAGRSIETAFFCTRVEHLRDDRRRYALTKSYLERVNPNTCSFPLCRTRQDKDLLGAIYERTGVLVDESNGTNPWGVRFNRLFDMSNDSSLFETAQDLDSRGFSLKGNRYVKGNEVYLPLYEAKMIWLYDHRYGTFEGARSRGSRLRTPGTEEHVDPAFLVRPRYWVRMELVRKALNTWERGWFLGFRNITNVTNERTGIFSVFPRDGVGNSLPLCLHSSDIVGSALLVSCLSSLVIDWTVRQKLGGVNMNFFYVEQLPVIPPSGYAEEDLLFIVPRVLELVYTAWDMKPFADDVWRESGAELRAALQKRWQEAHAGNARECEPPSWIEYYPEISRLDDPEGFPFPPFRWDDERRAVAMAELDAWYARLYGLSRKQLRYVLDPADLTPGELRDILDDAEEVENPLSGYEERRAASDFPGETFRVLRDKELRKYGEYKTRKLVLEAWERWCRE